MSLIKVKAVRLGGTSIPPQCLILNTDHLALAHADDPVDGEDTVLYQLVSGHTVTALGDLDDLEAEDCTPEEEAEEAEAEGGAGAAEGPTH